MFGLVCLCLMSNHFLLVCLDVVLLFCCVFVFCLRVGSVDVVVPASGVLFPIVLAGFFVVLLFSVVLVFWLGYVVFRLFVYGCVAPCVVMVFVVVGIYVCCIFGLICLFCGFSVCFVCGVSWV